MARTPPTHTFLTSASTSNPLGIAEIAMGAASGRIGITFAPDKQQPGGLTGAHRRDLGADFDVIAAWNAAAVVTLVERHELDSLGIAALDAEVQRRHMQLHHWPIQDYGIPNAAFEAPWPARSTALRSLMACGGRVLVYCKGGLGRAGTVSARLLVESGMVSGDPIRAVRAVRAGAIETGPQESWVRPGSAVPRSRPPVTRAPHGTGPWAPCSASRQAMRWGPRSNSPPSRTMPFWTTWRRADHTRCNVANGRTAPSWRWPWPTDAPASIGANRYYVASTPC